jgi:hypothetical protein
MKTSKVDHAFYHLELVPSQSPSATFYKQDLYLLHGENNNKIRGCDVASIEVPCGVEALTN